MAQIWCKIFRGGQKFWLGYDLAPPPHEIFLATPLGTILCLSKQFFYKPPIVPVLQKTSKICRTRLQKAPRAFWKHLPNIQHRYFFHFSLFSLYWKANPFGLLLKRPQGIFFHLTEQKKYAMLNAKNGSPTYLTLWERHALLATTR